MWKETAFRPKKERRCLKTLMAGMKFPSVRIFFQVSQSWCRRA